MKGFSKNGTASSNTPILCVLSENEEECSLWIATHTAQTCLVPSDYGLASIAEFLGPTQSQALQLALDGAESESDGDISGAMKKYAAAYRLWPSLDSINAGGIPMDVRQEAGAAGYMKVHEHGLFDVVSVQKARDSRAITSHQRVLNDQDIDNLFLLRHQLLQSESAMVNNPENRGHTCKEACMMNNPPTYTLQTQKPSIVVKLLKFAQQAWEEGQWSSPGGPLEHVKIKGIAGLSIRVMELWEYQIGGGLTDLYHYDTDSIVTIVTLLSNSDDFEGGAFRTFETGDESKDYNMNKGDAVAFVSHKYHNITPLTRGCRNSLVIELWQGGVGHQGR